jgi:hypothetical protein
MAEVGGRVALRSVWLQDVTTGLVGVCVSENNSEETVL